MKNRYKIMLASFFALTLLIGLLSFNNITVSAAENVSLNTKTFSSVLTKDIGLLRPKAINIKVVNDGNNNGNIIVKIMKKGTTTELAREVIIAPGSSYTYQNVTAVSYTVQVKASSVDDYYLISITQTTYFSFPVIEIE